MTPAGLALVDPGHDAALLQQVADVTFATQPEWERAVAFLLDCIIEEQPATPWWT